MTVAQVCTRNIVVIEPDVKVWRGAELMRRQAIGALIVVDRNNEPVGIVTDRDLVERVLALRRDAETTVVADVMTPAPATISEVADIEDALTRMSAEAIRRLIVVNQAGQLVGIVSFDDVLLHLSGEWQCVEELLVRQTPIESS